jgi:hypothetical protein
MNNEDESQWEKNQKSKWPVFGKMAEFFWKYFTDSTFRLLIKIV